MTRSLSCALVALALCGSSDATLRAQSNTTRRDTIPAHRFRLLGVYDILSGEPVSGVEVIDMLTGTKSETSAQGLVSLVYLPEGGNLVRLRKLGYAAQVLTVTIAPTDTTPITVLFEKATTLAPVMVVDSAPKSMSARMRAFEERRTNGFGYFVTDAELRKNVNHSLASIVQSYIPGIMSIPARGSTATYIVSARKRCAGPALERCSSPNCLVDVYVDGTPLAGPVDFEHLRPDDYAGVEFYHGGASTPMQYNATRNGCGTLLLWTR